MRKLAAQELALSREQRLLGESLAKGRFAITIGLTYYTLAPFIKANLPIKPLPEPKEGNYTSSGSGALIGGEEFKPSQRRQGFRQLAASARKAKKATVRQWRKRPAAWTWTPSG